MSAIETAKLAIDANFETNGVDAHYHSVWPSVGVPCKVLPELPDVTVGMDMVRVAQPSARFVVRKSEATPVKGGFLVVNDIRHRVEEAPQPDDFRLVYHLRCVKA